MNERKNENNKFNIKIENHIDTIKGMLEESDYINISPKENRESVLQNNKKLSNKIYILEKMSKKNKKIKKEVDFISSNFKEYEAFVACNLDQEEEYFVKEKRREKLSQHINNIELGMDNITLILYNCI